MFIYPLNDPQITQTYAEHIAAKQAQGIKYYNPGLDLISKEKSVRASADGDVAAASFKTNPDGSPGYGGTVKLSHADGFETLYAHLASWSVSIGQHVKQGDIIGIMGSTGNTSGEHVHFEVRKDGICVDPELYLPALPTSKENGRVPIYYAEVINGVRLRSEPSTRGGDSTVLTWLPAGLVVAIHTECQENNNWWADLGAGWAAINYEGQQYLKVVQDA